jgi:hypothetical protein
MVNTRMTCATRGPSPWELPTPDRRQRGPLTGLLDAVASANQCRVVWSKHLGFCTVIGHATDLDAVELLFTSLLVQATGEMTRQGSRKDPYGRSRSVWVPEIVASAMRPARIRAGGRRVDPCG